VLALHFNPLGGVEITVTVRALVLVGVHLGAGPPLVILGHDWLPSFGFGLVTVSLGSLGAAVVIDCGRVTDHAV
jgi:hypothetical protein